MSVQRYRLYEKVCMYVHVYQGGLCIFILPVLLFCFPVVFCEGREKCILQPHLLVSFSKSFHNRGRILHYYEGNFDIIKNTV